ncbi:phosphomannomutase/phosphoglucomutase [Lysobacter psychrotolerans]|uniref:phosphomannomutase n=2 Tax=Montanilutibacter psychrotolerans TaxID=1327343 RepID=A0A3M8STA6_9GAMM|nr:phosphomannomutase/phosphoglucomutase [Lysobacter psychrotolerans]
MARPGISAEHLRPLRPVTIVAGALVAIWFAWSGWQQHQDDSRREGIAVARDDAVNTIAASLANERKLLDRQLSNPELQAALAAGDLGRAGNLLTQGWPGAKSGVVLRPDLELAYGELPKGGYGRLVALEAAIAHDKPVAWIVRDSSGDHLSLAAPVRMPVAVGSPAALPAAADGTVVAASTAAPGAAPVVADPAATDPASPGPTATGAGAVASAPTEPEATPTAVATVQLPLSRVTDGLNAVDIGDDVYLALRQSSASVIERGDTALSGAAEALAAKVPDSDLRVAAAVPDVSGGPFGLGAYACYGIAFLFAMLTLVTLRPPSQLRRAGAEREEHHEPSSGQTLTESLQALPPEVPAAPVYEVKEARTAAPVAIDRSIFRAYDIRGVVGQSLDAGVAELIGHAIGSLMHEKGLQDIVVGRDGRLSGPVLVESLIAGLLKAGRHVIDIGQAPTPLIYFGAYHLRAGSCVSVTGSHNPPDYNGFKIVVGGETLSGDAIVDLYSRIAEDRLYLASMQGSLEMRDIAEDYVQRVSADVQIDRPLKVVIDAGNGVAGDLAPRVLAAIGAEVTPLYCDVDGNFPNHHPDPSDPHNLTDLIRMVERLDADLGVAFDGDGDRLGVVTRDGQNIFPDRLLMLFAADVLERNPGAMIIYDVKCTGRLPGQILRHGGSPLMWKTGHSLIKAKMRETDAELAGEMSGHFFFKERWYGFDDGIYAAARLLEILAARPQSPSETLNALPDGVATAEIKVAAPGDDPHAFVDRFVAAASFPGARLSTIDGLRVDFPDGWGLVRASNTTPVLVLRFDGDSREALLRIQDEFRGQLLAIEPGLSLPF